MNKQTVKIAFSEKSADYKISIAPGSLDGCGKWARRSLGGDAAKIVIVSNPTVYKLYGEKTAESLRSDGFSVSQYLMGDGEKYKSWKTAEFALKYFAEIGLSRTDAVVALGGGVVGDLAGFAAAIYLRGVRFLQIPTTLLSMVDSSVGGKTGVNSAFGKNMTGAFHQPNGVMVDVDVLKTLPKREIAAGFCEMIKHGAISGKRLLKTTDQFLERFAIERIDEHKDDRSYKAGLSELIAENIAFKAKVVAGDERESAARLDGRSRKILNFGHTLAHALEKVTEYKYFKHGEAVGYGIVFAAELSKSLDLCDEKVVKSLYDILHRLGPLPSLANIDRKEVLGAFRFDKKNLSGSLQMVLLKEIGKPIILTEHELPRSAVQQSLNKVLKKWA